MGDLIEQQTNLETVNYFGYGSNLWLDQVSRRTPNTVFLGISRLAGYRWIIMERGYANIVQVEDDNDKGRHEVWGLVFAMPPQDEKLMDRYEGAPLIYQKVRNLRADFWTAENPGDTSRNIDITKPSVSLDLMTYIDHNNVTPSKPRTEYITRMNLGIRDALSLGVPEHYVNTVMRRYIPAELPTNIVENTEARGATRQPVD